MGNVSESQRKNGRLLGAARVLTLCALFVALGALPSFGASTSGSSSVSGSSNWLPQNGFSGSGSGLTANVGMCFGATSNPFAQLAQQIQQIKSRRGGAKSAVLGPGACGHPVVPNSDNLKCSAFTDGSGAFSQKQFDSMLKKVQGDASGFSCQQNELTQVQQDLQCVKQQSNLLASQLAQLKSVYQQNIQRFQQDVQNYDMRIADRESQMQQVAKLLGGDQSTGKQGLVQLQAEMQGLVNQGIPTELQTLANGGPSGFDGKTTVPGTVQIAQQNQMVQEEINQRQLALMNQCFAQTPYVDPSGHALFCPGSSNPVSAEQYIVCTYGAGQNIVGNNYDTNTITQGIGQQNTTSVNTIFSLLSNGSPQNPLFPTTPQQQAANLSNTFSMFTLTDIQNQITSRLPTSGLGNTGYTVQGFTNSVLGACYTQAQYTVQNEEQEASSAIGYAMNQLKTAQSQNQTEFTKALQNYSQDWSKVTSTLSSQYAPMDVSQCQNATPGVETSCLNNIQTDMQGVLTGTGQNGGGNFLMQVTGKFPCMSGNDPTCTQIPPADLTCHSLSNCVQLLQQLQPQLQTAHDNMTNQKQQYVTQAKQSTQQFTNQLVQMLNQQVNGGMMAGAGGSAGLQGKLDQINQILGSLNLGQISTQGVQPEPMQFDKNGLPQTPNNMVAFLGSQLTPPMPDLSNIDTSSIQNGAGQIDQNAQDASNALDKMKGLEQACQAQTNVKTLAEDISNFTGACGSNGSNPQGCSDVNTYQDALGNLANSLSAYALGMGSSVSTVAQSASQNLSGWINGCQKTAQTQSDSTFLTSCEGSASPAPCSDDASCGSYALKNSSTAVACYQAYNAWHTANLEPTSVINNQACLAANTTLLKAGQSTGVSNNSSTAGTAY